MVPLILTQKQYRKGALKGTIGLNWRHIATVKFVILLTKDQADRAKPSKNCLLMLPTTPKKAGRASIGPYILAANAASPSATIQAVGSVIC
jgi:hypothetical protein